jgi:AraC family transcriptional regulator, regulatory protein of adaptative response / DNA-3-methyladenine glycosylase II
VTELELTPPRPYRLADAVGGRDPPRRMAGGVLDIALLTAVGDGRARVWQRHDGTLGARIEAHDQEAALDRLRFALGLDVDHTPFLRMAERDELLGPLVRRRPALRPARCGSFAQSLVRALAGQLLPAVEAARIERQVPAAICERRDGLRVPPSASDLRCLRPAVAERCGLSPRRSGTLARLARTLPAGRLAAAPTDAALRRLTAEPGIGPWAAGVICGQGLGRPDAGPAGDLGLVKLCSALLGRKAVSADTERLLDRYAPWQGFAAAHLLSHPLAHGQTYRGYIAA